MKHKRISRQPDVWAVIFDKGDEFSNGMLQFARETGLASAAFSGIGAFQSATLGFFDRERKDYEEIPIDEQVEVVSLMGNITQLPNGPKVHAHAMVARRDGSACGGHLIAGRVWPTLEITVAAFAASLQRAQDAETDLALIDLDVPPKR